VLPLEPALKALQALKALREASLEVSLEASLAQLGYASESLLKPAPMSLAVLGLEMVRAVQVIPESPLFPPCLSSSVSGLQAAPRVSACSPRSFHHHRRGLGHPSHPHM